MPSRPGEFHPEPLTDPDVRLSPHPARATLKKAAAFHQDKEFLRLSVDSIPMWMTCSLRSTGVTPLLHYYEAGRPWPVHRYFRPRGCSHLCTFPCHHRPGSQVPYESQDTSHAFYTPDIAWAVSRWLPYLSQSKCKTPVLMSSEGLFDASSKVSLHSSLVSIPDVIYRLAF